MSSATFELSRANFDVFRLQLKATFNPYPGLVSFQDRSGKDTKNCKGEGFCSKETEAATGEAGCSCDGSAIWTTEELHCWCYIITSCQSPLPPITLDNLKNEGLYQVTVSSLQRMAFDQGVKKPNKPT